MGKIIIINLLIICSLLLLGEVVSYLILKDSYLQAPLFFNGLEINDLNFTDKETTCNYLDPTLGWSANPKLVDKYFRRTIPEDFDYIPGFICFDNCKNNGINPLKIVVTGGSTSDNFNFNYNWPVLLFQKLDQEGFHVQLYNGATAGYRSTQELLKIIRDVTILQPHILISYSGVNENFWPPEYPFTTFFELGLYKHFAGKSNSNLLPNLMTVLYQLRYKLGYAKNVVQGLTLGIPNDKTRGEQWLDNIKMMKGVSDQFGIKFVSILQPMLGIGKYNISEREKKLIDRYSSSEGQKFYTDILPLLDSCDYIINFTDIFEGRSNFYFDDCHVDSTANSIIAERIYLELLNLGYLDYK